MLCWHQWGAVHDRLQTCIKCGKVRVVKCPHVWESIKVFEEMSSGFKVGEIWVLQCKRCGEIKQKEVGL